MTRLPCALLLAALATLVAACGGEALGDAPSREGPQPSIASTMESAPTPADRTPTPRPPTIRINVAGDVHFEEEIRPRLDEPDTALAPISQALGNADVTVVNLETAITERGTPEPKTYRFRASPVALDALEAAGVDVVSMANNHAVDYGATGLSDTLRAGSGHPVRVIGIGTDEASAYAPAIVDVDGTTVAFLAATLVPDRTASVWPARPDRGGVAVALDPSRLVIAVRQAATEHDVVLVYLHYGVERVACPVAAQRTIVTRLAQAGADVVVGSHAHVLLGAGWHGRTYVSYGMGNFVWYSPNSAAEATSGVLQLTVRRRDGLVVRDGLVPTITGRDGLPRVVEGQAGTAAVAGWRRLRGCAGLAKAPS